MAISMTEAAAQHIRRSLNGRGKGEGIRLVVRTTGCSGLAYVWSSSTRWLRKIRCSKVTARK